MRVLKPLAICLILGGIVVSFGQACGPMSTPQNKTSASSSSTSSGGSNTPAPGGGSNTPAPGGGGSGTSGNPYGFINPVSTLGSVYGEARDPANPMASVMVYFFVDGPQGSGLSAGQVLANQPSLSSNGGNTKYTYQLPAEFRNGASHTLYAYAFVGGQYQQLSGSPQTYVAYAQTAAGQAYYEANLRPQLQTSCARCHTVSYTAHFSNLLTPPKHRGGTATNNDLINKMAGHAGGTFCTNKSAGLCATVQNWWNLEFN